MQVLAQLQGCIDNGIPVGCLQGQLCHVRSRDSRRSGKPLLILLGGRELDFPIWLDLEYDRQRELPKSTLSTMVKTFWAAVTSAGIGLVFTVTRTGMIM